MNTDMGEARLFIERIGHRGEGVARHAGRLVFVPYALAGETVRAKVQGEQGRLIEVLEPSPQRIAAICPHYGVCGGCAVQTLAPPAYAEWKRGLVVTALRNAGLDLRVGDLVDAHGAGRRRVTFHARFDRGRARVGFMQARAHEIVDIDACPLLEAGLSGALPAARAIAAALIAHGKPLDIVVSRAIEGLDIDLRGAGALSAAEEAALIDVAERHDVARLSNHGRLVALRQKPHVAVGGLRVAPPPGAFLQATQAGEEAIARHVVAAAQGAKRIADLFCGFGAFALRLAATAQISAYDSDAGAIAALNEAARASAGLRLARAEARDLFKRPLSAAELAAFDAVVFDPPRAGAEAQAEEIAKSSTKLAIAVSCNALTFARDAKLLTAAGFEAQTLVPIDQFRFSPHVEIVAVFARAPQQRKRRPLLR